MFFFQAEDGIRDLVRSRGLGDVYKRQGRNYELGLFDLNEKFDALYLIAGLKLNFGMFNSDLVIADSHLISGDYRKQTIIKLSLGIKL